MTTTTRTPAATAARFNELAAIRAELSQVRTDLGDAASYITRHLFTEFMRNTARELEQLRAELAQHRRELTSTQSAAQPAA